jgi:hypothetical protein
LRRPRQSRQERLKELNFSSEEAFTGQGLIPEHLLVEIEEHEERKKSGLVEAEKPDLERRGIGDVHETDLRTFAEFLGAVEERNLSAFLEFVGAVVAKRNLGATINFIRKVHADRDLRAFNFGAFSPQSKSTAINLSRCLIVSNPPTPGAVTGFGDGSGHCYSAERNEYLFHFFSPCFISVLFVLVRIIA